VNSGSRMRERRTSGSARGRESMRSVTKKESGTTQSLDGKQRFEQVIYSEETSAYSPQVGGRVGFEINVSRAGPLMRSVRRFDRLTWWTLYTLKHLSSAIFGNAQALRW
jgi:hypothetical protein